jgi:Ca2+-binding RTX toxin-like protein
MVKYIKSDLEFILAQIKIAEAHASGAPLFGPGGLVPAYNVSWGLRTVDGSYNNLLPGRQEWGAADNEFPSLLPPVYRPAGSVGLDIDGPGPAPTTPTAPNYNPSNNPASIIVDGSLRTISNLIVDQTLDNPAAIMVALKRAGSAPAGTELAVATTIKAEYDTVKPLVETAEGAHLVNSAAQRTLVAAQEAHATAPTPETQAALDDAAAAANAAQAASNAADAALAAARDELDELLVANGIEMDGDNIQLLNVAPDVGLSASFNSWFTLFGQFFDHGLDLVAKGGSGTVFIPLEPDDPLYDPTSPTNFMVLTRATVSPGPDGVMGTADDVKPINTTTSFVDQNQTYTSHPSHQVFLREYVLVDGKPEATGNLLDGADGGLPTWGEIKAQARNILGIDLTDYHVGNLPLLATDPYGNFIPNPNAGPSQGFPQVVMVGPPQGLASGTPAAPLSMVTIGPPATPGGFPTVTHLAARTGHAFLDDIAHTAAPVGKLADGDLEVGLGNLDPNQFYDQALLDAHFITGDGRGNENIGLTAVHHVFHSEHNRLMAHTQEAVLADAAAMLAGGATQAQAVAFLNEWLDVDVAAVPTVPAAISALNWDGERLFQAAKFGTEMQYQHLVFEEFARKIQPNVNVFVVPDGYDVTIDPTIVSEFANVVYRFGHSMLTESIDRLNPQYAGDDIGLIQGFLNPLEFASINTEQMAGSIIRGMTRQVGNEIDEFVTSALRNNLLGLPLDLATINLARGRDTGVPSLNSARAQFYQATNNAVELKPYDSWVDFAGNLKNEASIINFVAAYGTHALITGQTTIEGKRDAALTLITGQSFGGFEVQTDAEDFLNATGAYAGGTLGGLNNVDLWIGGLAEAITPFGGMLGSTFNFVFETMMEELQNGDRFYYLQRLDGLHLFGEMENNSFAAMIMRNTNATHLPSDVFSKPGLILEVDRTKQYNDGLGTNDPTGSSVLTPLVIRNNPTTSGLDQNYLRYTGADHVVLGGTEGADILIAGLGDDALYGDGGNDTMEGGHGVDIINGGAGDDIIRDMGGDDNIKGGDGDDVIHAGPGLDLVLAGAGKDFVFLGTDMGGEVFGGEGDDFIYGNKNAERLLGNEGNDWIETGTFDGAPGDNFDEIFAHDGVEGHDVFLGDGGFDEFIAEGGDDILVGSPGRGKMAGMSGFDWMTYKDHLQAVDADLTRAIVFDENPTPPPQGTLDAYEAVEGLSGSRFNDLLTGSNTLAAERLPFSQGGTEGYTGSRLTKAGVERIAGLQQVLGISNAEFSALAATAFVYSAGDIILGGDGSDVITGLAGDDIIDGDKWLDVRIGVFANEAATVPIATYASMTQLADLMFAGTYKPSQLRIVRDIKIDTTAGDIDVARYQGLRTDYTFGATADGLLTVTDIRANPLDGSDKLRNIERLRFSDNSELAILIGTDAADTLNGTAVDDLIFGLGGGDSLSGLGGNDILEGGAGADTLDGGAGNDTMRGGADNDVYVVDAAGDVVDEAVAGSGGVDRVDSTITYTLGTNVENLNLLGTAAINGTGNGLANVINGNAGANQLSGAGGADTINGADGDDLLTGGAGADILDGGAGNDTLRGGADNDVYVVDAAGDVVDETVAGSGGVDRVDSTATYTLGANVENLNLLGTAAINGTGNALANVINGNAGANQLSGAVGADTLNGADGADTVNGGDGADLITGGTGADSLTGGVGNDTMRGGADNDVYVVDAAGDVVDEAAAGSSGVDQVDSTITYTLGANVENLNLLGSAAINGTGNALANVINGNAGANQLFGAGGADTVNGGDGADLIDGGIGNDSLTGGAGNDTVVGGDGGDTINVSNGDDVVRYAAINFGADTINGFDAAGGAQDRIDLSALGVTSANLGTRVLETNIAGGVRLTVRDAALTTIGTIDVTGVAAAAIDASDYILASAPPAAAINGTNGNNNLNGTAAANIINGLGGNDTVNGLDGADTITGGVGNDVLNGDAGDDTFIWNASGPDGRDVVNGGVEGTAGDTFVINGVAGAETYRIYTRAAWDVDHSLAGLNANTEIIVTRNGTADAQVIAELREIEEIRINGADPAGAGTIGGDNFQLIGDFSGTSLRPNTFTLEGTSGDDRVDISGLTSNHRVVFTSNGGADTVVGAVRTQDAVDGATYVTPPPPPPPQARIVTATNSVDLLMGAAGADIFVFRSEAAAGNSTVLRDVILNFASAQDRIDLSGIDASRIDVADASDNDAFGSVAAGRGFSGAAQIRYHTETIFGITYTVVEGNTDNDNAPEFQFAMGGVHQLNAMHFIL